VSGHYAVFPNVSAAVPRGHLDDEVVLAVRAGSSAAFTELYDSYSRRLYKVIVAITKNPEDAEDALQDAFLRAYRGIRSFEGRSTLYSWLTRIAINSALMILRKRRVRSEVLFDTQADRTKETVFLEVQDPSLSPEEVCDIRERLATVKRVIGNLSPQIREPLRMRIEKEASIEEIGQTLKITGAAVKARLHRARRHLSTRPDLKRLAVNHHGVHKTASKNDTARPAFPSL